MSEKFEKQDFTQLTKDLEYTTFEKVQQSKNPIILDTNFLFITFEFRIDLIAELRRLISSKYSLYIYEGTIDELKSVERKGDKNKKFLPLIAKMLHVYDFKIIKSNQKYIDQQILENLDDNVIVATNDKELRQTIQKMPQK